MCTKNRDLSQKCIAQEKSRGWQSRAGMAALLNGGVTQPLSLVTLLYVISCSQDLTVQRGCWSPDHHVLSSSHQKKGRIKEKETKSTYKLSFQEGSRNLLLLTGQNLGTWPHLDARVGSVLILDDCVASQKSRILLLWKKGGWIVEDS